MMIRQHIRRAAALSLAAIMAAGSLSLSGLRALAAEGETEITEADCVKISYPNFFEDLNSLTR